MFSFLSSTTKIVLGNANIITLITYLLSFKSSYHITIPPTKVACCSNGFALLLIFLHSWDLLSAQQPNISTSSSAFSFHSGLYFLSNLKKKKKKKHRAQLHFIQKVALHSSFWSLNLIIITHPPESQHWFPIWSNARLLATPKHCLIPIHNSFPYLLWFYLLFVTTVQPFSQLNPLLSEVSLRGINDSSAESQADCNLNYINYLIIFFVHWHLPACLP